MKVISDLPIIKNCEILTDGAKYKDNTDYDYYDRPVALSQFEGSLREEEYGLYYNR